MAVPSVGCGAVTTRRARTPAGLFGVVASRLGATTESVRAGVDNGDMDGDADAVQVTGLNLRYVLSWHLVEAGGSMVSLAELVRRVEAEGFAIAGRASKTVSDALRWEVGRGRVVRIGRGLYRFGVMPRQTKSRIRHRVAELRQRVVARWRDTPLLPPRSPARDTGCCDDVEPR
jgi:hypothetical protein